MIVWYADELYWEAEGLARDGDPIGRGLFVFGEAPGSGWLESIPNYMINGVGIGGSLKGRLLEEILVWIFARRILLARFLIVLLWPCKFLRKVLNCFKLL
jgi:hypothetical protein